MLDATPEMDSTVVMHKRGRPCKLLQLPSYDDKPVNASPAELKIWKQKKNTEKWHYEKLTSSDAVEYREREQE